MTDGWDEGYGNTLVGKKESTNEKWMGRKVGKGGMDFLCTNIPHILPLPSIYLFWKIGKGRGARDCGFWRLERTGGL